MKIAPVRGGVLMALALGSVMLSPDAAAARGRMEGNTYVSPQGNFRCVVTHYELGEIKIKDAFDKDRGTVAFNDFFDITRVDFETYKDYVDPANLSNEQLERVHAAYFDERVVPLVKSGVQAATELSRQFVPGAPATYVSVMLLPDRGGEQVRGAVQYTDGHAMYVVSVAHATRPELGLTMQRETEDVANVARAAFNRCQFLAPGAEGTHK